MNRKQRDPWVAQWRHEPQVSKGEVLIYIVLGAVFVFFVVAGLAGWVK